MDWVDEVDAKFRIHNYSDPVKFGLVVSEFRGYAMTWWNKYAHGHELSWKMPVDTWTDLKCHMRKRFVQPWCQRDMIRKMHKITQGTRSVEDYFSEFESFLYRVQIDEHPETTMTRFLQGLRRDITQKVETMDYLTSMKCFTKLVKQSNT